MGLFDRFRTAGQVVAGTTDSAAATGEQDALRLIDEGNAVEQEGKFAEALQRYDRAIQRAPDLARAYLNRGNALLELGDPEAALQAYATALAKNPEYAAAHYNSGNAYARSGRPDAAALAYRRAVALKPDFADAEVALGSTLEDLGQLDEAIASYRRALAIQPDYPQVQCNLGNAFAKLARFDEASASYRSALAALPRRADLHNGLGQVLRAQGQLEDAVASFRRAVEIDASLTPVHFDLAETLCELGRPRDALASYRRVLELQPNSAGAHNNLANALKDLGQFDEAITTLRRALEIDSGIAAVHFNLGNTLLAVERLHDAATSFRRALEIDPRYVDAHCNLGNALYGIGLMHDALASYRRAVELEPDHKMAHNNLGNTLTDLGQADAAVESYREALRIDPDFAEAHSNLLFSLNYRPDQDAVTMRQEAGRYGDRVARRARPFTAWSNTPDPARRLRVGFVSGDLRDHAVGYFVEGVLAALASMAVDRLEIFGYPAHHVTDAVTERIRASCSGWHSAVHLSDEMLAHRIRDDRIDILIDLSGHTDHNRLPMFAWKPAPVQVTWLGYLATTGVAAIDYLIADRWTLPESEEVNFTEKIWRLPESYLCFTPRSTDLQVSPLPALSNRRITFGSFNNLTKVNDNAVALWARVLTAVPDSQLFLKAKQFGGEPVRKRMIERFGAHGVGAERLVLAGFAPLADYLAPFQKVDISLDPFPYPGITTSVESLFMGVPVLTLAGKSFLSRQGVGLLMNADLPEWIAVDADDYVARAVAHSGDTERLASLRSGLRQRVLSSPIFDTTRFADRFAAALRGMWQEWCRQQTDKRAAG